MLMWMLQLPLPVYLGYLTLDKERRYRALMATQGLSDWAYLTATYCWQMILYCVFLAVVMAVGWAFGLTAFTLNDVGVQVRACTIVTTAKTAEQWQRCSRYYVFFGTGSP